MGGSDKNDSNDPHSHHDGDGHDHSYKSVSKNRLLLSLIITVAVMLIEFVVGILANSIALVSDAGHMFTHAFAIAIGLIAIVVAARPPCDHRTFGMYRSDLWIWFKG